MRHVFFMALAAAVGLLGPPELASAKTCKCSQHNADATGEASCSLSESPDYCTISFPTAATTQTPPAEMFYQNLKAVEGAKVGFADFIDASQNVGDYPLKPTEPGSLAALALAAIPPNMIDKVRPDFTAMFETDSSSLKTIVEDFNNDGCVEAQQGILKILIIAYQSEKNGRCE